MNAVVTIDAATKRYGAITAVSEVSLDLLGGETLALVGHNGAGKTTLVKLILGLIRPSVGRVRVFDQDPATAEGAAVRRRLGFLPENVAFHAAMSGRELMGFYAALKSEKRSGNAALLDRVGLATAADRRVGTYSKGMRQRLGLAQALIGDPKLLLLDEPTSGLDPASRADFYTMIDGLRRDGVTVLLSTHALAEVEAHVDRVAVMHGGRLIAAGRIADLRRAAALPVLVRLAVTPCSTGRVLERLSVAVEILNRNEQSLVLGCGLDSRMALLRDLAGMEDLIEDMEVEAPGLEALYRHLVAGEGGT